MEIEVISDFDDEYYFLSNFTYAPFKRNGLLWDTVEHYYQAMKTTDLKKREEIRLIGHPRFAKRLGRRVLLRPDWESVKYLFMLYGVRDKFRQNPQLAKLLKDTAPSYLVEGNTWHDNIWGDCSCLRCTTIVGQNLLGKILMRVRREL